MSQNIRRNKDVKNYEYQGLLANLKARLDKRYAKLHQKLSRSGATQTSKINLVKDYELVQTQIEVFEKTIRELETRVMIACAKTE
jgi:uncharacterized protein YqiB (DUF1249 family)